MYSLRVRAEPTTTGQVVATLSAGDELLITASFDQWGPLVHEAIEWYPVVADGPVYGWVAGDQGGTELLEPAPIACSGAPDSAAILAMTPWERLVCIGDDTVTITGVTEVACQGGARPDAIYEPLWLADWCPIFALTNRESVAANPTARMILAFPPDFGSPFDIGIDHGSIVEVSGHFDDPAAAECNVRPSLNEEWSQPAVRVLCREQFVVTDVKVKGHLDIPSPG